MIEIREYLTADGQSPFGRWLRGLRDRDARARILVRLNRVRLGNFGDCRPVGHGVMELRLPFGPGYRVYFARQGDTVAVLLCGGDKGSQRTDIDCAVAYWRDYRSREDG